LINGEARSKQLEAIDLFELKPKSQKASVLAKRTDMLNALDIILTGSFQARFATDPDIPTHSPYCNKMYAMSVEPSGNGYYSQNSSFSWTLCYGETAFDRRIRLSKPVALRTLLMDTWEDVTPENILVERAGAKPASLNTDPLNGQIASLGADVFFWDPRTSPDNPDNPTQGVGDLSKEELRNFRLSIGGVLTANSVATPVNGGYGDVARWKVDYSTRKSQLASNQGVSPEARKWLLNAPGWIDQYANFFQKWGAFPNIALKDVTLSQPDGVLKELGKPADFDWSLTAIFYRFDGDTLTGRFLGDLFARRKRVTTKMKPETDIGYLLDIWG
jgi:hypothetical protein